MNETFHKFKKNDVVEWIGTTTKTPYGVRRKGDFNQLLKIVEKYHTAQDGKEYVAVTEGGYFFENDLKLAYRRGEIKS